MSGRLRGLAPIGDADTRVLILGSFPSEASLAAQQYYGHPQNHFWRLVGDALGVKLYGEPYDVRVAHLLRLGVGVWDVFGACEREGSLDSAIRNGKSNDIAALAAGMPRLARVCFNGKTAARHARAFAGAAFEVVALPSSSPAYTLAFEAKLTQWRAALAP